MIYKKYQTKTILNTQKKGDSGWFWTKYSASAYKGCEWGCIFCYSRDEKYNPYKPGEKEVEKISDPYSEYIKAKENAPELLRKALVKKPKDLIYISGYQPVEKKYRLTRQLLEVCLDLKFPVFVNERSPLLLDDLGLLKNINEASFANVGFSMITGSDNDVQKTFEPKSPPVKSRFEAMKKIAGAGILTGTIFMPILPFLSDDEKTIEEVVKNTKDNGGKYVLSAGLTLWGSCGDFFYKKLQATYPDLVKKYKDLYRNKNAFEEYTKFVHLQVKKSCQKYGLTHFIPRPVNYFPKELQINKKIAALFHLRARDLSFVSENKSREWDYRNAGWALEWLVASIVPVYKKSGVAGLEKLLGVSNFIAKEIATNLDKIGS